LHFPAAPKFSDVSLAATATARGREWRLVVTAVLRVWGTHPAVGPLFAMVPTATSCRVHSRPWAVSVTMHCLDLGMLSSLVVCGHPTPGCKGSALTSGSLRRAYIRQRLRSERSWGERPSNQLLAVLGAPAFGLWTRWLTRSERSKYTICLEPSTGASKPCPGC
jgi:hypothetical protein